ncbi:hypothetical protein PCK1_001782 [Pneumocystis canis]|nr:hypothetical protein PCK1_001782 [Pneumocystis canis]
MMDDLLVYSVEQVAFEGDKGCTLSRLWEILNDFYTIYFNSSVYCIDDDFKSYFWNFFIFLSEIILNEVDERSTSLNLILKPIKTKVDLKLLKELYNDRIRITVIPEKQFLLLTGKELDEENKHVMRYFDLLSIIFKHKEKGINQVDLAKQLNIDPRSLPSRINPLIEKGLIIKSPIIISKTQTFLLTHSRYVIHSSQRYHNNFQNLQDTDNIMNINHLRVCITDILSKAENNVMRFVDLKRLCKINTKLFRRGFSRQIRSMEQLGFLERCRVLNNKGYSKCVKLVKPYNIGFLKQDEINILNDQDDENSSLEKDDSYDIKEEEPFSELIKSSSIKITRDLTIEFLLFQEIENSGKDGIPGPDLKKKVIGDQWSRPLQLILDKLSVIPEKSLNSDNIQPDYLSYFTIYKEQEFVGRINQYRYLSSSSYQIFCLENKIVNTIKFSGSNVVFPTYDKSKFYLYDENPNIPEKNTKIKSLKLGRPKKHHNDMIKDSEEKNQLLKNSFAKNKLSQNSDEFDYINNETDQALCSGSMRHNLNSKRMNSQEKSEEIFPRKKLKKVHITPPTKTVITRSCSNLSTTDTLNNSEIRDFASKLDNQASKASVLKISDEVSIENFEKSTLQNHMDKNDCEKLLDSEIYKESPTSKKKDSDLSSDFPDKLDFEKNFNIDNKNAQVSSLKHEPRISLAYVRRQNLILEILDKNNGILQGGKYLNEQYNIASKNKTYLPSEHEIDRKTMEKTLESLKRIGKIHHICVAHTNAKGVKNVFWIVADTKYDIDGLEIIIGDQWSRPLQLILDKLSIVPEKSLNSDNIQPDYLSYFTIYREQEFVGRVNQYRYLSSSSYQTFCFENKLINTMKFSDSNVLFPTYDKSKFYLYNEDPNIPEKNIKIKSSKLGRPKKPYNDMIKDLKETNQLFENSSTKNGLSQNSQESDHMNKEIINDAVDSSSTEHNLNFKRINSQKKTEEICPRKKLKKNHVTHPPRTIVTRSCSNLNATNTLNDSEVRDFTLKTNSQDSKASILELSDVSTEISEQLTFENHIDKNDHEKFLNCETYKKSVLISEENSNLLSDFFDKWNSEKKTNINDKKTQVSSLKHEPRISLAYVRRQNLILEILDKNNGILQGGKYLNEQYNIASKNKAYSSSEHEIDRKTMEKTLESLKRTGKIHHICVAHTNAKGVKNVFWIVADTKYDIDGLEISNFKNKILEERSMKIQTYKPLPLKIENLRINYPIKSKRRQSSLPDNEFSKHIQLNHIQYKHISEDSTLKGQELIPENTLINDHTFSSTPKKEISFVHTFVNNNEMTQKKVQVIESKSKLKFNGKSLFFHRKFLNQSTKDVFSSIEKQNLLDKNSSPDKTGEINDHEKVYKSVSIRRKNNFTSNDDDILIRAVFLSRWAYSGNTGFIDWELIKKILPHHSETAIKSRFSTLRSKNYIKEIGKFFTTSWLSYYQNAIENKILEPISPIPNDTDIITLVEYSKTLNILEDYDDIDLPDTIEEISANYIVENINKRADIRNDFFDISLSLNARELILYGTVFSYSNIDQNFQDENEIKSIIKSILITPEENYDPEIAKKLLEPYQEDHIESALQELIQDKIIVRSKSELNRILPGRNYRFSDKFLFAFKTCFPDFLFSQAAEFYTQITEEFQKNNVFTLSEFINSGSMACILDLVVHQYVQLSIENVMNVFCDHICQYDTQNWEDYTINFPVIAKPKNISYTLLDKSIKYENSLKRYIWIDISGNILKNVYNQYLQTILSFIIQRPGINLIELISILYPFISLQEIKAIISSLIPFIITDHHGLEMIVNNYAIDNEQEQDGIVVGFPEDTSEKRGAEFKHCILF